MMIYSGTEISSVSSGAITFGGIPELIVSCILVFLMAIFARHHQETGSVKQRMPLNERLRESSGALGEPDRKYVARAHGESTSPTTYFPEQPVDASSFSEQPERLLPPVDSPNLPALWPPETALAETQQGGTIETVMMRYKRGTIKPLTFVAFAAVLGWLGKDGTTLASDPEVRHVAILLAITGMIVAGQQRN
jgi:hypothetical protein